MASSLNLPAIPPFDANSEPTSIGVRWKEWRDQFDFYAAAADIKDKKQKRALLLHLSGPTVQKVFKGLSDTGDDFDTAATKLDEHFSPKKNIRFERYRFKQARQQQGESLDQFTSRLRLLAENCEFTNVNDSLADQILMNCTSNRLKEKILREEKADLNDILKYGRAFESSKQQLAEIATKVQQTDINALSTSKQRSGEPRQRNQAEQTNNQTCRNCGGIWPHEASKPCPAKGKPCLSCKKMNHFARVCRSNPRSRFSGNNTDRKSKDEQSHKQVLNLEKISPSSDDSSDEFVYATGTPSATFQIARPKISVNIANYKLSVMIDSGASINIIDSKDYTQLTKHNKKIKLKSTSTKIYAYGAAQPLPLLGKFDALTDSMTNTTVATFYVASGNYGSLLGHQTAVELGLIKLDPTICTLERAPEFLMKLQSDYQDIFQGIGKLKDFQFEIHVDPNIQPVAQPPRRVPFHIRKQVESELEKLEAQGIIETVNEPTPWVSPVVAVPKVHNPEEIRLCVDLRQPNRAVQRQRHPTPTIDEVTSDLNGATVFSKLDLRAGYHQIELKPESRYLTTFATHKGLRRYTRLLFGLSSASEIFQHVIQQALQGLTGVKNISDDIIIFGRTQAEHDEALAATFQRLREKGLTLNADKCVYNKSHLAFFGFVFSDKGMSADPKKIEAIVQSTPPTSPSELRSFLGLTGFCSRFIADYATLTEPLKVLTRKGATWQWGPEQQQAFAALKTCLTDNNTVSYFDPQKKTVATFDASPFGLGAVLTQVDTEGTSHVVAYASRTLTDVERRYSQTEREALAIVWGCERFHLYLYGSPFEIVTDHKPLELIFNNPSSTPPARIQRWGLRLQPYDFTVVYRPGSSNIADYLSRHPLSSQPARERNIAEQYVNYLIDNAIPKAMTLEEIDNACKTDTALQKLRQAITSGKWVLKDVDLQPYYKLRHELTAAADSNVILRGSQIIIPTSLRKRAVALAHEGHQGIVKTKQLMRQKVWYPGIDSNVEQTIANCIPCQAVGPIPKPEPLIMTEIPAAPWTKVCIDFCGPFPSGDLLLVVIDEYSRYPEVEIIKSTAASTVLPKLDRIFATHGIPVEVKSDNGPPFQSLEFARYAQEKGFKHRKITPLWAPANSEAERFMRTVQKAIRTSTTEGRNWKQDLQQFLLQYRATPHSTTAKSPAELLFGRVLRTKLPEQQAATKDNQDEALRQRDHAAKQKMKKYADQRRNHSKSTIKVGDTVLIRQRKKNKLSTRFKPDPVKVVERKGSMIVIRKRDGTKLARNVSYAKKISNDSAAKWHQIPDDSETEGDDDDIITEQPAEQLRPARQRRLPNHLRDFVLA